jgi:putative ABC transport system permease protein
MSPLGRVVRAGVGRRRVQTVVIGLVVMVAVTSAVLGGSLMVASRAPFDRAFDQQRGAHLTAIFDAATTTAARLSASARATGITAAAGPFATAQIKPVNDRGRPLPPMTVVGRADPGGPVDQVTLIEGRWATGPDELVLAVDGRFPFPPNQLGRRWTLTGLPGNPNLTIVGVARSISRSADAWAVPAAIDGWAAPGGPSQYQMLYRLAVADTDTQVDAARAAVAAAVPGAALNGAVSWLTTRRDSVGETALLVPFLIAFGVLGVAMAVLIVGNIIAGAVGTATRRIGILKALGFTPAQVVRAYLGQALVPAGIGAALGLVAGNLLILPLLAQTNRLYGTTDSGVAPWVDAVVFVGALVVVTLTGWAAAARAGRLRSVDALAVGRTPKPGRGQWAARLTGRLPAARPMTLGLAHPFARPVRSATIVAAIAFGTAAVTFATGLGISLNRVQEVEDIADVAVRAAPPAGGVDVGPVSPDDMRFPDPAAIARAIAAQAGTDGYTGMVTSEATTPGVTGAVDVVSLTGTNAARYYRMVSGNWLTGPGQVVVSTPFLTATGKQVGDTVVLTDKGTDVTVRLVGEVFNVENDGMQVLTDLATLRAAEPDLAANIYYVTVREGTDPGAYAATLTTALGGLGAIADTVHHEIDETLIIIHTLTAMLSLLLVVVAALGVMNVVVLETRERVHDLGVHKALGMTPGQTVAMVIASVVVTGLAGGAIGAPIGLALQRTVITAMGRSVGFNLPASMVDVYSPAELLIFGLGGLVIAVVGALLPAGWAARTRTAVALRTE